MANMYGMSRIVLLRYEAGRGNTALSPRIHILAVSASFNSLVQQPRACFVGCCRSFL